MALDFSKYLDVDVESVPKTLPSVPGGHWFATIQSWKGAERDYDKASGGPKTPVVELTFKLTSPDSDVEDEEAAQRSIGKLATKDYNLADGSGQTMLRNLAEDTLSLDVKGLHFSDVLDALKGQEVKVFNNPRAGKEEGQFYTNITKVLSATA